MKYGAFDKRMKKYEFVSRHYLTTRTPVIIRIDGKAFHTFTRGFQRPFDDVLSKTMQETMKYLCENIQGCVLGYTQSDEITLILVDYKNIDTSAWFDYNIQKCASVAASMATMAFNKFFNNRANDYINSVLEFQDTDIPSELEYIKILNRGLFYMKIGYIVRHNLEKNPHLTKKFEFKEATFTRKINSRGDKIYSKMLIDPIDYEEIVDNANWMKENPNLILVTEPFLLDDELREKAIKWVDWANNVDSKEYDFFAQ